MSSIYIQEPPTSGKVLLYTTVGDIDIEIWSKETPKASRNFVQLCLEGYYDGTCFHRLVKGFIVQGGDPTGTGMGGDSVYGKPFKDEFHTRLRFVRRGLVAMANAGKDDNASQFFFSLDACPELTNKHTIFGKVTGNTLYNMLKLEESLTDKNERPLYPHKIISTKVITNPFPDIVPRTIKKSQKDKSAENDDKKAASKGTKNFSLLSFGEEAEEEEAETDAVVKEYRGKSKSSHDLTNDPKLSSVPAVESDEKMLPQSSEDDEEKENDDDDDDKEDEDKRLLDEKRKLEQEQTLANIRKKLKKEEKSSKTAPEMTKDRYYQEKTETEEKKRDEIRKEIKKIQRELSDKKKEPEKSKENIEGEAEDIDMSNSLLVQYHQDKKKYKEITKKLAKGQEREKNTLEILAKFTNKLLIAKEKDNKDDDKKKEMVASDDEDEEAWLTHHLSFEEQGLTVVKDANIKTAESYDISDPRNPMNERRREKGKTTSSRDSRSRKH